MDLITESSIAASFLVKNSNALCCEMNHITLSLPALREAYPSPHRAKAKH